MDPNNPLVISNNVIEDKIFSSENKKKQQRNNIDMKLYRYTYIFRFKTRYRVNITP